MGPALVLPRLIFGAGSLLRLSEELSLLGVSRALLISDRGLERAGLVQQILDAASAIASAYLDVPENPTARGADEAATAYRANGCDAIVALGGGSVLDTAKLVSALVCCSLGAEDLIGHPELIPQVAPLVAIPTTVGTGSESSPVAALHRVTDNTEPGARGPLVGTRGPLMVPRVALCDPDLARSLPPRLVAATGIDALSHCIEGFLSEPANPVIDAMALDGVRRVFADLQEAMQPEGDAARASLMAAAFAGGAAIHKGLGPAHAVAAACGDQHLHHGTLVSLALPHTTRLMAGKAPEKTARLAHAVGVSDGDAFALALADLIASVGLPTTLPEAGYRVQRVQEIFSDILASPFNRTSPYVPSAEEYRAIGSEIGLA